MQECGVAGRFDRMGMDPAYSVRLFVLRYISKVFSGRLRLPGEPALTFGTLDRPLSLTGWYFDQCRRFAR